MQKFNEVAQGYPAGIRIIAHTRREATEGCEAFIADTEAMPLVVGNLSKLSLLQIRIPDGRQIPLTPFLKGE